MCAYAWVLDNMLLLVLAASYDNNKKQTTAQKSTTQLRESKRTSPQVCRGVAASDKEALRIESRARVSVLQGQPNEKGNNARILERICILYIYTERKKNKENDEALRNLTKYPRHA